MYVWFILKKINCAASLFLWILPLFLLFTICYLLTISDCQALIYKQDTELYSQFFVCTQIWGHSFSFCLHFKWWKGNTNWKNLLTLNVISLYVNKNYDSNLLKLSALYLAYNSIIDTEILVDHWKCLTKHQLSRTKQLKQWYAVTTFWGPLLLRWIIWNPNKFR